MGILFITKLSWTKAQQALATQSKKSIISILKLQKNVGYFEYTELFKLFDTMVTPILTYGSEIWGYKYAHIIENVHNQFCCRYLKLYKNTFHSFVRGECGRYPLFVTYYCKCIKYWLRLVRMSGNRYPKQCYIMLKNLDESGRITWVTHVKDLLFRYGFGIVWLTENVGDDDVFINVFKQRLIDCALQDWHTEITQSRKALHYRHFKTLLNVETYLKLDILLKFKIAFSRFRCSAHNLLVETGRHNNISYEDRICTLCDTQSIEDEYHVFMKCPFYNNLRHQYLEGIINFDIVNHNSFYNIVSSSNPVTLKTICVFVYEMFKHRNEFINTQ